MYKLHGQDGKLHKCYHVYIKFYSSLFNSSFVYARRIKWITFSYLINYENQNLGGGGHILLHFVQDKKDRNINQSQILKWQRFEIENILVWVQ